jgi:hypothetical protein
LIPSKAETNLRAFAAVPLVARGFFDVDGNTATGRVNVVA